jgi:hypothetical protein
VQRHHLEPAVDRVRHPAGQIEVRPARLGRQHRVETLGDHFPAVRSAQDPIDQLAEDTHRRFSFAA